MAEYIPKYPSQEGDDSNKSSSELLAETLKPNYVPQELMLAWESHLASYSRDTHELLDQVKESEESLNAKYQALLARVQKYEQMLQDITMDSNEFTMDTDEVNFTGWNILAQASYWDYLLKKEITKLSDKIKGIGTRGELVTDITGEILEGIVADNNYISNVIEALSNTPLIQELDAALNSTTSSLTELQAEYVRLAEKQVADAEALAEQLVDNAEQLAASLEAAIAEQLDRIAEEAAIRTQLLQELEAKTDAMTAEYTSVVDALHTTVIQELTTLQDGITTSVSELKSADEAIITSLDAYKVSNGENIAALQSSVNVVTNAQESTANQVTGLVASYNQLESGLSKVQADIVTSNKVRADEDAALSQQITTINSGLGEANSRIDTVSDSVSTLDSATATKFTQLDTRLGGVDDSIASVRQIANSAVNTNTAQATEINTLKSKMATTEGSLATKADASALSSLDTRVGNVEGQYTTQASAITSLTNSLDTTIVNVGNAQTAAQNAMNAAGAKGKVIFGSTAPAVADRLVQNLWIDTTGNANTPKRWNGSAWVAVTDKVASDALAAANAATNLANTKADATAFNSLDQKVTVMDGQVKTNTNSITSLNGKVSTVENGLATKLNTSAINNYYTKTETDAKATTIAAGKVEEFSSNLKIGGSNLYFGPNPVVLHSQTSAGRIVFAEIASGNTQRFNYLTNDNLDLSSLQIGDPTIASIEIFVPSTDTSDYTIQFGTYRFSGSSYVYAPTVDVKTLPKDTWVKLTTAPGTYTSGQPATGINLVFNLVGRKTAGDEIQWRNFMMEKASKASEFKESDKAVQAKIDANSTAIQTTNTEVTKVDGKTTTNANAITGLTSRMGTVEGQVSTKAEASALNSYYTKSEADTKSTTIAAGEVSKYDASLVIGGSNLFANSDFSYGTAGWESAGTGASLSVVNDTEGRFNKVAQVTSPSTSQGFKSTNTAASALKLEPGIPYTMSGWVRASVPKTLYPAIDGSGISNALPVQADTTWKYFTITKNLTSNNIPRIYGSGEYFVANVKLEKGTKATDWEPSSSDVKSGIDANASAISNTNSEVTRVDGRVTATNSNVTSLTGRVSTVEGNLTTKADVSAVNALTTRVGNVEGGLATQATNTTNLTASLATTDTIAKNALPKISSFSNYKVFRNVLNYYYATSGSAAALVIQTPITFTDKMFKVIVTGYNYSINRSNINVEVSGYAQSAISILQHGAINHGSFPLSVKLGVRDSKLVIILLRTVQNWAYPQFNVDAEIGYTLAPDTWKDGWSVTPMAEADFATNGITAIITPTTQDVPTELAANATAISTTNTEVSRINGVVSGHTTQLSNLTATVAGKADTTALNSLTARVAAEESKSTSQATSITNLNSSVTDALKAVTVADTRSTNQPPSWYLTNYPRRIVNEFKTQTVIGVGGFFGGTYCNLETKVYYADLSGGDIIQTATSSVDPSLYVQRRSNGTAAWTAWTQPIKALRDDIGTKASASALSTLDTKVTNIDGVVTSQATQITTLTSDNTDNKNALQIYGQVIDGVKANYMVKMETNGVIGGFGLMQSTGTLGQVVTTFGVNANSFYIGAPSAGKKPFVVTTSGQQIDGITYPAGTYINTALIANATIGTAKIENAAITNAKIASLDASKITTGTLDAARIRVGAGTTYDAGYDPSVYGWKIKTDATDLNTMKTTGKWLLKGTHTNAPFNAWTYLIVDAVDSTRVIQTVYADNNVSVAYQRTFRDAAWDTWVKTNVTPEFNNVTTLVEGQTLIEGGKIRTNSITADRLNVTSLSAISANLGTIQVDTANIADAAITTAKIEDLQITGAKIGNLEVDTLKIKDDAVSIGIGAQGVHTLSTVSNGGKLRLDVGVQAYDNVRYSKVYLRVLRNGTVIRVFEFSGVLTNGDNGMITYVFSIVCALPPIIETIPAGTTVTYSIQVGYYDNNNHYKTPNETAQSWVRLSKLSMAITELKK